MKLNIVHDFLHIRISSNHYILDFTFKFALWSFHSFSKFTALALTLYMPNYTCQKTRNAYIRDMREQLWCDTIAYICWCRRPKNAQTNLCSYCWKVGDQAKETSLRGKMWAFFRRRAWCLSYRYLKCVCPIDIWFN